MARFRIRLILALVLLWSQAGAVAPFIYRGKVLDDRGQPVSGVFPLEFTMTPGDKGFEGEAGGEALWVERHFVAIIDGQYHLVLGKVQPIPEELAEGGALLKVVLLGLGELVAERISLAGPTSRGEGPARLIQPGHEPEGYAEFAERAVVADRAEAVGQVGAKSLQEALDSLKSHKKTSDAHHTKTAVGTVIESLEPAGGEGGDRFTRLCPRGYVVTGLKGRAGVMLDQIQVVCSELK